MIDAENIDPGFKKVVDHWLDWINELTDLCLEQGAEATHKPIDEIPDENLRRTIFWLILARASDKKKAIGLVRERARQDMLGALHSPGQSGELEEKIAALQDYIARLESYVLGIQRASVT